MKNLTLKQFCELTNGYTFITIEIGDKVVAAMTAEDVWKEEDKGYGQMMVIGFDVDGSDKLTVELRREII